MSNIGRQAMRKSNADFMSQMFPGARGPDTAPGYRVTLNW
jgi:hypothetical protein